jgi:hypothetical protein
MTLVLTTNSKDEVVYITVKSNDSNDEGILYDGTIPGEEVIFGKRAILKYDTTNKTLYYEYEDRPFTPEEKIQQLESELAISKEDNVSNMLAITELYELILGGTA